MNWVKSLKPRRQASFSLPATGIMTDKSKRVFDRSFVVSASAVGIAYALFMALLSHWTSGEVAGAAGIALTSIGTAIFKEFEKGRIEKLTDEGFKFQVVRLRFFPFIGAVLACLGIVVIMPFLAVIVFVFYKLSGYHAANAQDLLAHMSEISGQLGLYLAGNA